MDFKKWFRCMWVRTKLGKVFINNGIYYEKRHINWLGTDPIIEKVTPNIPIVELFDYGFNVKVDISRLFIDYERIESIKGVIKACFDGREVTTKEEGKYISITVINRAMKETEYKYIELSQYELLVGYDMLGTPLIADMRISPHILVSGLSGQGKSKMLYTMLSNLRNVDIIVCKAYREDYEGIQGITFLDTEQEILEYIEGLGAEPRQRPLYILLEELATYKDKKLLQAIKEGLCIWRHSKIFCIGVIQIALKESCPFKDLFNSRCTMKQIDKSAYMVALGVGVDRELSKRDFVLLSNGLSYGRTYLVN